MMVLIIDGAIPLNKAKQMKEVDREYRYLIYFDGLKKGYISKSLELKERAEIPAEVEIDGIRYKDGYEALGKNYKRAILIKEG